MSRKEQNESAKKQEKKKQIHYLNSFKLLTFSSKAIFQTNLTLAYANSVCKSYEKTVLFWEKQLKTQKYELQYFSVP